MSPKLIAVLVLIIAMSLCKGAIAQNATIAPGDKVKVTVLGCDDLTTQVIVDDDGRVSLPLVGSYAIGGKTSSAAASDIKKFLLKYVKAPSVNVEILEKATWSVVVAGMVKKSGACTISSKTTLLEAIQLAGGADVGADLSKISLARAGGSTPETIDLRSFMDGKDITTNPLLHNGDMVIVPSSLGNMQSVYILGEVKRTGPYEVRAGVSVREAIAIAGGLTDMADSSSATLKHETGEQKKLDVQKAMLGDTTENAVLSPGDTIFIPSASGTFNVYGAVPRPGQYPVKGSISLTDALAMAGGYNARAKIKDVRILRSSTQQSIPVNLDNVQRQKAENMAVLPGDTVVVPEGKEQPGFWQVLGTIASFGWMLF